MLENENEYCILVLRCSYDVPSKWILGMVYVIVEEWTFVKSAVIIDTIPVAHYLEVSSMKAGTHTHTHTYIYMYASYVYSTSHTVHFC